ncbi:MAG: protein-L-isoaspartate O-methyltransferase [Rhodospirillaceae bacterium]|nr:protein-L-isoaspartate O-methyltransferase [Rhodospirillaceae bacterium]|tara:strand:- start:82 stop:714 length:633 start_codon:yes stop_codon:yes gene_type:complete
MSKMTDTARLLLSIRKEGITDQRILTAFEAIPRHLFVPKVFSDQAYDDVSVPIACDQTVSQPSLVAFMVNALEVGERMKVLEVGTGSGYQTAVLSLLCRRIYSIERHRPLELDAVRRFAALDLSNISSATGDGSFGWPEQAPFSRIIVSAAVAQVPQTLLDHMADDGIMIIPIGETAEDQILYRFRKSGNKVEQEPLIQVHFLPLVFGLP